MDKEMIREIVKETIMELHKSGLLKSIDEIAYTEVSSILKAYYDGRESDDTIREALKGIENDQYFKIIPLYFNYDYTIEKIAETLNVEISTIVRNKKRLCISIYNLIK